MVLIVVVILLIGFGLVVGSMSERSKPSAPPTYTATHRSPATVTVTTEKTVTVPVTTERTVYVTTSSPVLGPSK